MDGYIFVQIRDDKIDVWGNEFLLGELTVSMMNTPEKVLLELLTLTSDLKRLPLNSFHMYPLVPCEPPRSKLAARRVPTIEDLKIAQKQLTIASKLLSSIEVGSLVTRFYPLPQTDLDKLRNVDRRSKQFKEILADYVVCYNNYLLAANDIIAMYDYIRNYVYNSMNHSDSLDVSSLSKTYRYVMSKDDSGSIGEKEKASLLSTLEDLYFEACSSPKYSNEEFEQLLDSERLYKLCGIEYQGRGRPRSVRRTKTVKRTQNEQGKQRSYVV